MLKTRATVENFQVRERDHSFCRFHLLTLWGILMKQFKARSFFKLSSQLEYKIYLIEANPNFQRDYINKEELTSFLELLEKYGQEINLPVSMALLSEIKNEVKNGSLSTFAHLGPELHDLRRRIEHELSTHLFLYIPQDQVKYYNNSQQGWERVIERWGNTISDIEEAGKCFALGRYTATVFHSLQVVEFGLIELGGWIGVDDLKSGWTAVTNELKGILKKKYNERTDLQKRHTAFLEQVQGTTEALKNAWRNKISHTQGKLALLSADFNQEIAEEILIASRAFMRQLADEMPTSVIP